MCIRDSHGAAQDLADVGIPAGAAPVSYTHLDVYKRQVLHNLNNPMMMKGPIRSVFPAGPQVVSLAIPAGRQFAGAKLLVSGREAHSRLADGRVEIDVPWLETLEVVHVTWA